MTQYQIKRVSDLSKENSKFNIFGGSGVASAGQTTDIDIQLPQERWIEGGRVILYGQAQGDSMVLQIVAAFGNPAGIPENTVLGEHATNVFVVTDKADQGEEVVSYIALIQTWMRIRIKYTSVGQSNVNVYINLRTHIPSDV